MRTTASRSACSIGTRPTGGGFPRSACAGRCCCAGWRRSSCCRCTWRRGSAVPRPRSSRCWSRSRRCSSSTVEWLDPTRSRSCSAGSPTARSSVGTQRRAAGRSPASPTAPPRRCRSGCTRSSRRSCWPHSLCALASLRRDAPAERRVRLMRLARLAIPTGVLIAVLVLPPLFAHPQSLTGKGGVDLPGGETLDRRVVRLAGHAVDRRRAAVRRLGGLRRAPRLACAP